jgi:hypothetical protein
MMVEIVCTAIVVGSGSVVAICWMAFRYAGKLDAEDAQADRCPATWGYTRCLLKVHEGPHKVMTYNGSEHWWQEGQKE